MPWYLWVLGYIFFWVLAFRRVYYLFGDGGTKYWERFERNGFFLLSMVIAFFNPVVYPALLAWDILKLPVFRKIHIRKEMFMAAPLHKSIPNRLEKVTAKKTRKRELTGQNISNPY